MMLSLGGVPPLGTKPRCEGFQQNRPRIQRSSTCSGMVAHQSKLQTQVTNAQMKSGRTEDRDRMLKGKQRIETEKARSCFSWKSLARWELHLFPRKKRSAKQARIPSFVLVYYHCIFWWNGNKNTSTCISFVKFGTILLSFKWKVSMFLYIFFVNFGTSLFSCILLWKYQKLTIHIFPASPACVHQQDVRMSCSENYHYFNTNLSCSTHWALYNLRFGTETKWLL